MIPFLILLSDRFDAFILRMWDCAFYYCLDSFFRGGLSPSRDPEATPMGDAEKTDDKDNFDVGPLSVLQKCVKDLGTWASKQRKSEENTTNIWPHA